MPQICFCVLLFVFVAHAGGIMHGANLSAGNPEILICYGTVTYLLITSSPFNNQSLAHRLLYDCFLMLIVIRSLVEKGIFSDSTAGAVSS